MSKRAFLRLILIGSLVSLFFLSSCGAGTPTPVVPDNELDVHGIKVYATAPQTMDVNTTSTITAIISSPDSATPFTSLYAAFLYGNHQPQQGLLYQLLQPSSARKSTTQTFELCMYITLNVDQTIFAVNPAIQKQWVVIAPDGIDAQSSTVWSDTITWKVTPLDPDGTPTRSDNTISVNVGFDAEVTCGTPSLLPTASGTPYSLQLTSGDDSIDKTATTTIIDQQLVWQNAIVSTPRKIIGATLPTAQTILLGWVTGFFSWIGNQLKGNKSPQSNPLSTPVADVEKQKQTSGCRTASCIMGIVLGLLIMVGSLFAIYFDPTPTITSTVIETAITLVGMALMIAGAWWIRPGRGMQIQAKLA